MRELSDQSGMVLDKGATICLAGATASGKSELALELARRLGGEIISVDSMQVYRGLDIGTAKPTEAERAEVPHHLLDVVDLDEPFDAAKFSGLAKLAIAEIQSRGQFPILCGGTGLYFQAYFGGLGEAPSPDADLRAELESTPLEELLVELEKKDPPFYRVIDRQNARRVIRAVEVIRMTGRPFSEQRAEWETEWDPGVLYVCRRESEDLARRINDRVDWMFQAGLVAETRELLGRGLADNRTAMQAIGYRQVVEHLRGERDLAETVELVKVRTRQFAKRQMTWLRRQSSVHWIDRGARKDVGEAADTVMKHLSSGGGGVLD